MYSYIDTVKIIEYNVDSVKIEVVILIKDKKSYHHKNLKNDLIEKGIELVNDYGVSSFSLRKVAAACSVSHAAPYSHFKSKEELLNAMQEYITDKFCKVLKNTVLEYNDSPDLLMQMGIAYVSFFVDNPHYFGFIYSESKVKIDLSSENPIEGNYKPFEIYKNVVISYLDNIGYKKCNRKDIIVSLWAFIHGVTSLASMPNVYNNEEWKEKVVDYMNVFSCSFFKMREED